MRRLTCLTALALATVVAGCGGTETVTVTEEAVPPSEEVDTDQARRNEERAARRAARRERAQRRARRARREQKAQEQVAEDASGGGITVPNVVGVDHQLAQDTMQGAGLYLLQEQDCTGQDRLMLWDRNWVVVSQNPPAGSTVSEDTTITLCAKKDGE